MTYSEADLRNLALHGANENEPSVSAAADIAKSACAIIDALRVSVMAEGAAFRYPISASQFISRLAVEHARTDVRAYARSHIAVEIAKALPITFTEREERDGMMDGVLIVGRIENWRERALAAEERVRHLEPLLARDPHERFVDTYLAPHPDENA